MSPIKTRYRGILEKTISPTFFGFKLPVNQIHPNCYLTSAYNIRNLRAVYSEAIQQCVARGKIFMSTAFPQYDDTNQRPEGGSVIPAVGSIPYGMMPTYTGIWEDILAAPKHPWVAICTFTEWNEGTIIFPTREFGFDRINATLALSTHFHAT